MDMFDSLISAGTFVLQGIGYFFVGLVVLIFIVIIFGDRRFWKYETQGHCEACENGKLKIELKSLKRKGTLIVIKGKFKPEHLNKELQVLHNGFKLASIDTGFRNTHHYKYEQAIEMDEPQVGDTISALIDNKDIYTQKLYKD